MNDSISRQAAIDAVHQGFYDFFDIGEDEEPIAPYELLLFRINKAITARIKALQSDQPETCAGCKHVGRYPIPCNCCKRCLPDFYER